MLCDFQQLDDHRRRCRRCGLTVRVRGNLSRPVWAECQAIELGEPAAWRPCAHLGPQIAGKSSAHQQLEPGGKQYVRMEPSPLVQVRI